MYELVWFRSCLLSDTTKFARGTVLKKTNIVLDSVHDQDMYEIIEKGKRGCVCQVSPKYCKANNKYMKPHNQDLISS